MALHRPVTGTTPIPPLSKKFVGVGLERVAMEYGRGLITDGHFSGLAGPNQKPGAAAYIISALTWSNPPSFVAWVTWLVKAVLFPLLFVSEFP